MYAIPQEHALGCAVACVAYRCRASYGRALKFFTHPENAWTRGFFCDEVVAALEAGGLHYGIEKFQSGERTSGVEGTIVFIEPGPRYPSGHYLLKSHGWWMNPWMNFPEMIPVLAGFQRELEGKPEYLLFEKRGRA